MPGIVAIVTAISDAVVAELADKGYPPLTDGEILLGRQHQFAQSAPPRIIMYPAADNFLPKDVYGQAQNPPTDGQNAQLLQRSLMTDELVLEVRCWGTSLTRDPNEDYDYTQILYQSVLRQTHLLAVGNVKLLSGVWTDSGVQATQIIRDGREFVFRMAFGTPVLDTLLAFAPADVKPQTDTNLQLPDGTSDVGCQENP